MNEMTFEAFCGFLDDREKTTADKPYAPEERKFLWNELGHKADDVKAAVLEWVKTGTKTELTVPEIRIPKGFWAHHDDVAGKPVSTSLLMKAKNMNYVAAAFTIDWLRREPRKALMVLRRGMI